MNGQERLFRAIGNVDEHLLERSEQPSRGRRAVWLAAGMAACAALAVLVWSLLPPSPAAISEREPSPPPAVGDPNPMRLHCLELRTEPEEPELRFSILVNEEAYSVREQEGVYTIQPKSAAELPKECKLEIFHWPGVAVSDAIEQIRASLADSYSSVEVQDSYWTTPYSPVSIRASEGTDWDALQMDVWFAEDGQGGVFVLESVYFLEAAEGHGLRFLDMASTFTPSSGETPVWFAQLEDVTRQLYTAAFSNAWDGVEGLLEENAMIAAYSEDLYASISIASIDYSVSGEAEPDSAIVSVKHRTGGEDSFVYLTMELSRTDGQWQAGWIALEK